ncbi:MAG: hypothetical protein RL591_22 [Planctomycetota bacterium]|jgi:hypothetical protein
MQSRNESPADHAILGLKCLFCRGPLSIPPMRNSMLGLASVAVAAFASTASASVIYVKVNGILTAQTGDSFAQRDIDEAGTPNITRSYAATVQPVGSSAHVGMSLLDDSISVYGDGGPGMPWRTGSHPTNMVASCSVTFFSPTIQPADFFWVTDDATTLFVDFEGALYDISAGDSLVGNFNGLIPPQQSMVLLDSHLYRFDFVINCLVYPGSEGSFDFALRFGNAVPAPGTIVCATLLAFGWNRRRR